MTCKENKVGEKFIADVANHKMAVVADDGGVCRSLRFSKGSIDQSFQITTWPNHLCISGDMGTLVFSRLNDMFNFFGSKGLNPKGGYYINAGYWAEKLESGDVKRFSEEEAKYSLKDWLKDYASDELDREISDDALTVIVDSLACDYDSRAGFIDSLPSSIELSDFDSSFPDGVNDEIEFEGYVDNINGAYGDYENLDCYTDRYIWLLNAIVWGIIQYRESEGVEVSA